jgi:DNA polymerase-1
VTSPRLLLVDGHSLAYRAFFALPVENFSTRTGQATNAVFGFTSMLINVLRDEQPTHVAVAFDVSRKTFRSEQYPEYKANRATTREEFRGQVELVKEVLAALNIVTVEKEGFEADDVIATLTRRAQAEGMDVVISSGDRDAFQLVSGGTTILYPIRGVSELTRMTPEAVQAKYGVPPERYPDLAALVGETSDNLPGVPGVGPKTAAKWITTYEDLDGIVANVDQIGGKAGESLRAHLDQVIRNRRLNGLVEDLDLGVTVDDLKARSWDREEVHRVFDGLEFRVLRDRLFEYLSTPEPEAEGGFDLQVERPEGEQVVAWLQGPGADGGALAVSGVLGIGGQATGLAVRTPAGASAWFDLGDPAHGGLGPAERDALGEWLADPEVPKYLHDAKPTLHALIGAGLPLDGLAGDTALAAYLSRPDQRTYDLADLAVRHLHRELRLDVAVDAAAVPADDSDQLTLDAELATGDDATPDDSEPSVVRAAAVMELSEVLHTELAARGGDRLMADLELPLVEVLREMEATGIAVARELLDELAHGFDQGVAQSAQEAYAAIGREVNLGSPKQLQEVLFDQLQMPKTKRIKSGYSTDADSLAELYVKTEHPFLQHLLAHRDVIRLRQTVEGLIRSVAPDGRIHTTYTQIIAATGRLSSTDPNLQNIPIRTDAGRRIREVFVVGEGYESLLTADYSQIEMRIMAHLSGDEGLIEAFRSGEDLHRFVGSRVFGVPPQEVTPAMRSKIKAMSYGLAYGLSAFGLSKQLSISTGEAKELMDEYFERFGGVRDYLRTLVEQARRDEYTATILGRRRYLPDLTSDNRQRREGAERMALNAPIQGSAADVIKVAMLGVDRALRDNRMRSRMLLQVHDELVLEVAPGERADVEQLVRDQMGGAADLAVPLEVSVGAGHSWDDAAH